jgi:hypothetical protein
LRIISDVDNARSAIQRFLERHNAPLYRISYAVSNIFEGLCFIYVAKFYKERLNYEIEVDGVTKGVFRFKCSTSGDPSNFSRFILKKDSVEYELHHNLALAGCKDPLVIYFADIAIIRRGAIQNDMARTGRNFKYCSNENLVTFAECKNLVAYSTLIASFLGMVFELKSDHLDESAYDELHNRFSNHLPPCLLISREAHIGAQTVISSIKARRYAIAVVVDLFRFPNKLLDVGNEF